jgi:hypothetical protein
MAVKGASALDVAEVTITLSRELPVNELEIAQTVMQLQGLVPDKLLIAQIPFVDDAAAALEELAAQKAEEADRNAAMYGLPRATDKPDLTGDEDANDAGAAE